MQVKKYSWKGIRLAVAGWIWDHISCGDGSTIAYENLCSKFGVKGCWVDEELERRQRENDWD